MENIQEAQQQLPIKGIRISRMNCIIIVVSCLMSLLLSATAIHVLKTLHDTYDCIDAFVNCSWTEELFMKGSDALTEQVRLYTVTAKQENLDEYLTELYEVRCRETAIEKLLQYDVDEDTYQYLQSALDLSNELVQSELYAIRLTAAAQGQPASSLHQSLQAIALTEEDQQLTAEQMQAKAQEIVFGTAYQDAKSEITRGIHFSLGSLNDTIKLRMEKSNISFQRSMGLHRILIGIQFAATLVGFVFTILLVVIPMMRFVKCIKERKMLRVTGAYECKCLAQTCNTMFALNTAHQDRLRYQAEHDALTGLLNRGAYDSLQQKLQEQGGQMGLLIIDVDKFKQINDGYGHETGDRVLKRVAGLLTEHFSASGSPARIGGDEFSVILTAAVPEQAPALMDTIEQINQILTHPTDGLPPVSLSVGGAFSADGFSDSLYKHADLALYAVKEQGRRGCRFYAEHLAGS